MPTDAFFTSKVKAPILRRHFPKTAAEILDAPEVRSWISHHKWYRRANPEVAKKFVGIIPRARKSGGKLSQLPKETAPSPRQRPAHCTRDSISA